MVYIYIPFPGGSDCQESAYNSRNLGSVPGSGSQEDPLKKEMAICSSILAWKSHRWRSLAGYRVHRESEMTEQLTHAHTHTHTHRWQKVRHNWATNVWSCTQSHTHIYVVVQSLSHVWLLVTHRLQHAAFPCPSLSSRICSNSCPLNQWCYLTISSSAAPFSFAFNLSQHQGHF